MTKTEHEIRIASDTHVAMTHDVQDATVLVASEQGDLALRMTRQQLETLATQIRVALSQATLHEPRG